MVIIHGRVGADPAQGANRVHSTEGEEVSDMEPLTGGIIAILAAMCLTWGVAIATSFGPRRSFTPFSID